MERSLIDKYFLEGLNEQEMSELMAWLEADESSRHYFSRMKNMWVFAGLSGVKPSDEAIKESERLFYRINKGKETHNKIVGRFTYFYRFAGIAAGILILLSSMLFLFLLSSKGGRESYYVVETKAAEKSIVHLSDGTTIWLNAESSVKIPENITRKEVNIYLQGEAYFDIPHLGGRKVVVHASDLQIKVVGTAFNVKNYPGEKEIETTLVRGKIIIEKSDGKKTTNLAEIMPNQRFVYDREKQQGIIPAVVNSDNNREQDEKFVSLPHKEVNVTVVKKNEEIERYVAWKDGRFIFRSEPFEKLAQNMERWFGVKIINSHATLNKVKFNGSFEKESVEQAMHALSTSYPFCYVVSHDTIYIFPK